MMMMMRLLHFDRMGLRLHLINESIRDVFVKHERKISPSSEIKLSTLSEQLHSGSLFFVEFIKKALNSSCFSLTIKAGHLRTVPTKYSIII